MYLRNLPKPNWKFIKSSLLIAGLIFSAVVFFHDDRHPDSITESDKEYILVTLQGLDQKIVLTMKRMEEFIAHPEDANNRAEALADAFNQWKELTHVAFENPLFYYSMTDDDSAWATEVNEINHRVEERIEDLGVLTYKFAEDIVSRGDAIDLDNASFTMLREAVVLPNPSAEAPCDHSECFLCRGANRLGFR